MNDLFVALVLGIVEGITEFIPISSTGHLLITEHVAQKIASNCASTPGQATQMAAMWHQSDLFNVVIQCGAVVAVLPLFSNRLRQMFLNWRDKATQVFIAKLFTAFFITGVGGLALEKFHFKLPEEMRPVGLALFIGGLLFVLVEAWIKDKPKTDNLTWTVAVAIGLAQLLAAVFPGTSRSGSTILFALILGVTRPAATEFSFLVGIPTMLAAGGLKIFKAFHHHGAGAPQEKWSLLILTTIISAFVSFVAVKWLLRYVQSHTFTGFGWYRIVFGGAVLAAAFLG